MINFCPQCNASIESQNSNALVKCMHCGSSVFIQSRAEMSDDFLLLQQKFNLRDKTYRIINHKTLANIIEYQIVDSSNQIHYLTKEDEDCHLTQVMKLENLPLDSHYNWHSLLPNTQLELLNKTWLVTEKKQIGNKKLSYLTSYNAEVLVLEFSNRLIKAQIGFWFDSMEIDNVN